VTGRHVEHHSIANDYGFLRWSAIKAVVARRGEVGIGPRRPIGSPADRPTDWCVMFDVRCPTCRLVGVLVCYDGVTTPWSDGAPVNTVCRRSHSRLRALSNACWHLDGHRQVAGRSQHALDKACGSE